MVRPRSWISLLFNVVAANAAAAVMVAVVATAAVA